MELIVCRDWLARLLHIYVYASIFAVKVWQQTSYQVFHGTDSTQQLQHIIALSKNTVMHRKGTFMYQ